MKCVLFGASLLCILSAVSQAQEGLDFLVGKWVTMTGPKTGEPILFAKAIAGFDAYIPWWGQTSILPSQGIWGDHVAVRGQGLDCYYYISTTTDGEMTWS